MWLAQRLAELRVSVMLLTRLPVGQLRGLAPSLPDAAWAYPLAGTVAALPAAGVFLMAAPLLPPFMAATLALVVGILTTGGLHEDGLADMCDGFGGGKTPAQKLEIMRDSRIGSYGALGLGVSLMLRVGGLAAAPDAASGALALLALATASRAVLPCVMALMQPARADGLGASAAAPSRARWLTALAFGALALLIAPAPICAALAILLTTAALSWLSHRQIGGFTGDTLGACQQAAEVAGWLVLAAYW